MVDLYCRIEAEYQTIDFMPNSYTHTFLSITIHNSYRTIIIYLHTSKQSTRYNNLSTHKQTINTMATKEEKAVQLEKEVERLQYELKILKEAKPLSDACKSISDFTEMDVEPFSSSHVEVNDFHKKVGGGGGCNIL